MAFKTASDLFIRGLYYSLRFKIYHHQSQSMGKRKRRSSGFRTSRDGHFYCFLKLKATKNEFAYETDIQRKENFDHKTCFPFLTIISVPMNPGQEQDMETGRQ